MRLSYSYELNTSNKERIFQKIIAENGVNEDNGNLFIDTVKGSLYVAILQFAQAIAKVSNMRHWRREVVRNLFFEDLETYVETEMASYHPQKSYQPISGDADHIVDFCFNSRPRPVYLIGVNNERTARLATITYQHLIIKKQHFVGTVVLESTDALGKRDWNRLLSAVDKTFPSLDDFREHGKEYLNRELV